MKPLFLLLFGACLILTWTACDSPSTNTDPNGNSPDTTEVSSADPTPEQGTPRATMPENVTGTYVFGDQEDPDRGGGYLVIEQLEDQQLKFQLDLNRGAPSFNSGFASGTIRLEGNKAAWTTTEYQVMEGEGEGCTISFVFEGDQVILTQEGSPFECGFGHAVFAHGAYDKQNDQPIFRKDGEGNL